MYLFQGKAPFTDDCIHQESIQYCTILYQSVYSKHFCHANCFVILLLFSMQTFFSKGKKISKDISILSSKSQEKFSFYCRNLKRNFHFSIDYCNFLLKFLIHTGCINMKWFFSERLEMIEI